jgi:hypothetical protein
MGIKKRLFPGCFETVSDFANNKPKKVTKKPLKKGKRQKSSVET